MDAARARLIDILQELSRQLAAGDSLGLCLRRLPRADWLTLCAPVAPAPARAWRLRGDRDAWTAEEAWLLARLALAAGSDAPERLASGLAELARDLAARP